MNSASESNIHPDNVLNSLLGKSGRSHRRENLKKVHEICRKHHESGARDFSLPVIGRLAEEQGVISLRALYNKQSNDYKQLIASWAVYVGPPAPKPTKALVDHELLSSIPDPRVRFIMQGYIIKCNKQEAQLNMLKSKTNVIVDRRPLGATISASPGSNAALILPPLSRLTDTQRDALQKVISPSFLDEMGWKEGTSGEIFKGERLMLPVGFATAIRRILED